MYTGRFSNGATIFDAVRWHGQTRLKPKFQVVNIDCLTGKEGGNETASVSEVPELSGRSQAPPAFITCRRFLPSPAGVMHCFPIFHRERFDFSRPAENIFRRGLLSCRRTLRECGNPGRPGTPTTHGRRRRTAISDDFRINSSPQENLRIDKMTNSW